MTGRTAGHKDRLLKLLVDMIRISRSLPVICDVRNDFFSYLTGVKSAMSGIISKQRGLLVGQRDTLLFRLHLRRRRGKCLPNDKDLQWSGCALGALIIHLQHSAA